MTFIQTLGIISVVFQNNSEFVCVCMMYDMISNETGFSTLHMSYNHKLINVKVMYGDLMQSS